MITIHFVGPLCKMFILASASLSKVNSVPKRYLKSSTCVFMQMHKHCMSSRKNSFQGEDFLIYIAFCVWHLFVWIYLLLLYHFCFSSGFRLVNMTLRLRGYIATSCFGVCFTSIDSLCVWLHVDKIILKYQCFLLCVFFLTRGRIKNKKKQL